jgi:hypothetical protein
VGIVMLLGVAGCVTAHYVPMRPPNVQMPTTDVGQRCWRQCMETARMCESGCRVQVKGGPEVNAMVPRLEATIKECKDRCADQRDGCLGMCR